MDKIDTGIHFTERSLEALGLSITKKSKKPIEEILDNQKKYIEDFFSSNNSDDDYDNEKRVYHVEDIQKILCISKNSAYMLIKNAPFRVVHIGNTIRISKSDFDRWLDGTEQRRI